MGQSDILLCFLAESLSEQEQLPPLLLGEKQPFGEAFGCIPGEQEGLTLQWSPGPLKKSFPMGTMQSIFCLLIRMGSELGRHF